MYTLDPTLPGRLLVTRLLCAEAAVSEPPLYLSLCFRQQRERYYELLQLGRIYGDWEAWLHFFWGGVVTTTAQENTTMRTLLDLFDRDRSRIETLGRAAGSARRLHQLIQMTPLVTIPGAAVETRLSAPTITVALGRLQRLGIVAGHGSTA